MLVTLALVSVLNAGEVGADGEYLVSDRPVKQMTRPELQLELKQLEDNRPGIGGPIAMTCVGAGLAAYGTIFLLSASGPSGTGGLFSGSFPVGYLFAAMLAAGAGLIVPGIWLWWNRREPRRVMGDRMDAITDRLEWLDTHRGERERRRYRAQENPGEVPPPPPPPGAENYQL
ncbi:MAG: hypothetical protein IPJ65_17485 [Archangiaceae bacterium]|nr:hypothetical protein [Archangiaceae bacterium]